VDDLKVLKNELQTIIKGESIPGESNLIQSAKAYLKNYTGANSESQSSKLNRSEEERALKEFVKNNSLFLKRGQLGKYVTEGAEKKIYYAENDRELSKVSDAIFYQTWTDYLNNLLLHNYFFPDTVYKLCGFIEEDETFFAFVKQLFVFNTESTKLEQVKSYLLQNGFIHKKNNDYYHPYLGIILEDLYDENVLTNNGVLFFVDTGFI